VPNSACTPPCTGPLAHVDVCHDLRAALWDAVARSPDTQPRMVIPQPDHAQRARIFSILYPSPALPQFFTRDRADVIANNCNSHCIYHLSADQIGHHMVFETHQGKTRVFQCSVKARVTTTYLTEHYVG
jgi:hypothetical protein